MKTIKIGRDTFEIKPGDYILYNEACYQFFAGDYRGLKFVKENRSFTTHLEIPKSVMKTIDLTKLREENAGKGLTKFYF